MRLLSFINAAYIRTNPNARTTLQKCAKNANQSDQNNNFHLFFHNPILLYKTLFLIFHDRCCPPQISQMPNLGFAQLRFALQLV
jgi:hypothetical protein